jgi:diaminopimelate epimerase
MSLQILPFCKYHGLGNDFVMIDNISASSHPINLDVSCIQQLCDRHRGIGADGVILASPTTNANEIDYVMKIYNADGSQPEMCGNGIRCMGLFVRDRINKTDVPRTYRILTGAGVTNVWVGSESRINVRMQPPKLNFRDIPTLLAPTQTNRVVLSDIIVSQTSLKVTCVNMGNPHAVSFFCV